MREEPSARGGRHKGKYCSAAIPATGGRLFFQDPGTHAWYPLRWTGLPAEGEVPAFGDTRVDELLKEARARGLAPKSDAELLPLLLELIGGSIPVGDWPTQMTKRKRTEHAREVLQARAAADDRSEASRGCAGDTVVPFSSPVPASPARTAAGDAGWRERADDIAAAADRELTRRRREAVSAGARVAAPAGAEDS